MQTKNQKQTEIKTRIEKYLVDRDIARLQEISNETKITAEENRCYGIVVDYIRLNTKNNNILTQIENLGFELCSILPFEDKLLIVVANPATTITLEILSEDF